jgi:hypothetical protein
MTITPLIPEVTREEALLMLAQADIQMIGHSDGIANSETRVGLSAFIKLITLAFAAARVANYTLEDWSEGEVRRHLAAVVKNRRLSVYLDGYDVLTLQKPEAVEQDAMRYRWLRRTGGKYTTRFGRKVDLFAEWNDDVMAPDSEMDKAIDAAMEGRA